MPDLPYPFSASMSVLASAPAVRRIPVARQEQRHVVVLRRVAHLESDLYLRVKAFDVQGAEVSGGREGQPIDAARNGSLIGEHPGAPVRVGRPPLAYLPAPVFRPDLERDRDAAGRLPARGVEHVRCDNANSPPPSSAGAGE